MTKKFKPDKTAPKLSAMIHDFSDIINANLGLSSKTKRQAWKDYRSKEKAGELEAQK
jgi:hypothetical protein